MRRNGPRPARPWALGDQAPTTRTCDPHHIVPPPPRRILAQRRAQGEMLFIANIYLYTRQYDSGLSVH